MTIPLKRPTRVVIFMIVLLIAAPIIGCSPAPKQCPACQRPECTTMAFRITLDDGSTVSTCCPRCGLHYLASNQQTARGYEATDFASGKWIAASSAIFVEGSDVHACAAIDAKRDAYGCCTYKGYDRCLPSLVAFTHTKAATEFQRQHGGTIISFDTLTKQK
jgi:hypothetical protein